MSIFNPFAIGFACVAASFTVGADYVVQSKANGSYPGEYAFADYLDSYGLRYSETLASFDKARRQAQAARAHLPEAPAGWQRQEWDLGSVNIDNILAGMSLVQKMAAKAAFKEARSLAKADVWEYTDGHSTIRVLAQFDPPEAETVGAVAGLLAEAFTAEAELQLAAHSIIEGVPFFEVRNAGAPGQLLLQARLGNQVTLAVASDAPPEDIRALLGQIDFDNLNQMLDVALPGIGSAAPRLSVDQERALLDDFNARLAANKTAGASVSEMIAAAQGISTVDLEGGTALTGDASAQTVARVAATEGASAPAGAQTNRLQLSGGRSCLGQSGGRLCD